MRFGEVCNLFTLEVPLPQALQSRPLDVPSSSRRGCSLRMPVRPEAVMPSPDRSPIGECDRISRSQLTSFKQRSPRCPAWDAKRP